MYLALCLGTVRASFVLVSRRGPLGQSGVGWLDPGWFSWATRCPGAVPSLASRDGLVTRMDARGSSPVLSAWVYAPHLQGYLVSLLRSSCPWDSTPGEGCLTEAGQGVSGHTRWRNRVVRRATIITAWEGTFVDALSRSVAGPARAALSLCQGGPVAYVYVVR